MDNTISTNLVLSDQMKSFHSTYKMIEKLGEGYGNISQNLIISSFGHIWKVQHIQSGKLFACKMVKNTMQKEKLLLTREIQLLSILKGYSGFTQLRAYGQDQNQTYFVMDVLGSNLEEIRRKNNNFSSKSTLLIGKQMISLLRGINYQKIYKNQELHQLKIIHRDIKPENFVVGLEDSTIVHLIDFGLSKFYFYQGVHIPQKQHKGMIGTARYASINAMQGNEQSRRDDLESLGYLLVYLHNGGLPWMNVGGENKTLKYQKIQKMKQVVSIEQLVFGLPKIMIDYFRYVKSLSFTEKPDYLYLEQLFQQALNEQQFSPFQSQQSLFQSLEKIESNQSGPKYTNLREQIKLWVNFEQPKPEIQQICQIKKSVDQEIPFSSRQNQKDQLNTSRIMNCCFSSDGHDLQETLSELNVKVSIKIFNNGIKKPKEQQNQKFHDLSDKSENLKDYIMEEQKLNTHLKIKEFQSNNSKEFLSYL